MRILTFWVLDSIIYSPIHGLAIPSIPSLTISKGDRNVQYHMSVHHMPVMKIYFLEIGFSGRVVIYLLLGYHSYLTTH